MSETPIMSFTNSSVFDAHNYDQLTTHLSRIANGYHGLSISNPKGMQTGFKSQLPALDVYDLPQLLGEIFDREQDLEGIQDSNRVKLKEDHVDTPFDGEVVTWTLVSRKPGTFSQGKPGNARVQQLVPALVSAEADPTYPGHRIMYYGQYMDNIIQLTAWASSGNTANRRARWLENLIDNYKWYLTYKGIHRIFFDRQTRDMSRRDGNRVEGRPLLYRVVTQKIIPVRTATLKEVVINLRGITPPLLEEL